MTLEPDSPAPPEADSRTAELLRGNETLRGEVQSLREQNQALLGRLHEFEQTISANRESRLAALNLMEDAIEARRLEQRENDRRRCIEEELRQADRRKDEFLATLAHELRTPLAPIRNSLNILRLANEDPGAAERVHEMMERQVNHMVRLIDDLLEVSRITRGRIELRKERTDLASIIRSAVETSKPSIEAAEHQLAISLPPEPILLEADPVRLAQVLANLLNNAAKYTENGGQIWLTAVPSDYSVAISVKDTGVGISPEMQSQVFELFTQVDRTYARRQGGLGIGLTLVRRLVEMHGGTVEVHSEGVGRGSEFIINLPLLRTTRGPAAEREKSAPRVKMDAHRILVVDDNRDAADSLCMLLRFLGAEVMVARCGQDALKMLQQGRPSVALLDIGMPDLDGYQVARQARQLPECRETVFIALTGWGQAEDRRRSKEAGFDFHLVKPIDLNALQELLGTIG
ncbi:MAG TPA: ATP-binding protein [Pirellulales bacterium]|jgi:signal transduction histidine kinase|nr:ATP-binding protein [Pirellulales bacterium]